LVLATPPDNPQTVFLGGTKLWRSTQGGSNLEFVGSTIHADQHAIAFVAQKPTTVWAGNDGGVWVSFDGGATWAHRNRGLQTVQVYAAASHPATGAVIAAGAQDNGSLRFEGSAAWTGGIEGDANFVGIDPQENRTWYASMLAQQEAIWRSTSAGATGSYQPITKGMSAFRLGKMLFVVDSTNDTLYAAFNTIYVSINRGSNWRTIKTGSGAGLSEFKTRHVTNPVTALGPVGDTLYVATITSDWDVSSAPEVFLLKHSSGDIYTQSQRTAPLNSGGYFIADLAVHPTITEKLYAAVRGQAGSHLFRSDNGAQHWIDLTPNLPSTANPVSGIAPDSAKNLLLTLVIDPDHPTHIYAAGEVGVWRSLDEGATWDWWNDNLPNTLIRKLEIQRRSRLMRAATYGRGVWERSLDALTARDADIYLRDNALDLGRPPTREGPDPFDSGKNQKLFSGADLKVT